jgi:signal transduction histidine kinase
VDPDGRKIAGNMDAWPPILRRPVDWKEMRLYREGYATAELFAIRTIDFPTGHRLLLGMLIEDRNRAREALLVGLLGGLARALPLALGGSLIVLRISNQRIKVIADVAERFAAGDLGRRLDSSGTDKVYVKVDEALNSMLARIAGLVHQLQFVTDALAHDLRSPLTRMRACIEKAASQSDLELAHQALHAVSHEIDGMMRLISTTLQISRSEAGIGRENFELFDLGELIRDLCDMYHPLAEDRGVTISVEKPRAITHFGNRELIGQAVSNLVDNALKYGNGGRIDIGADEDESQIRLWVADGGPGIPSDRREDALQKYSRLEQARTSEGSGLGLSLVRAVARLHGGELTLEDNSPGLRAIISLPRSSIDSGANIADR